MLIAGRIAAEQSGGPVPVRCCVPLGRGRAVVLLWRLACCVPTTIIILTACSLVGAGPVCLPGQRSAVDGPVSHGGAGTGSTGNHVFPDEILCFWCFPSGVVPCVLGSAGEITGRPEALGRSGTAGRTFLTIALRPRLSSSWGGSVRG